MTCMHIPIFTKYCKQKSKGEKCICCSKLLSDQIRYISGLSNQLIAINHFKNKSFSFCNVCVYRVYLYVYINTHTYMYIFKKYLHVYSYLDMI